MEIRNHKKGEIRNNRTFDKKKNIFKDK